jgi:TRAP-type C4-dicarboxylate transport system permease small subunit
MDESQSPSPLARFDRAVYRAERALAGVGFLAMSLAMFLYVAQRVYSRGDARLPHFVLAILGKHPSPAEMAWWNGDFSAGLNLALTLVACYAALRTMKLARPPSRLVALAGAAGATVVLGGLVKLVLVTWPNGVVWAPRFCGACMLWVGFLGASIATYEKRHLALEMGEKLWPKSIFPFVKAIALVTAAAMCVFLVWLAALSIGDYYRHHDVIDPSSLRWPKWAALMVLPYSFAMMIFRFLYQGGRVLANPEEAAGGEAIPGLPTDGDGASS